MAAVSAVPNSFAELAAQLRASAIAAFISLPRPPQRPQAVAGRTPAEMQARRVLEMAARPPLPRLQEQSLDQLKRLAAQRYLTKSGTKAELIRRLFASRWPKLRVVGGGADGHANVHRSVAGLDSTESRAGSYIVWSVLPPKHARGCASHTNHRQRRRRRRRRALVEGVRSTVCARPAPRRRRGPPSICLLGGHSLNETGRVHLFERRHAKVVREAQRAP
jgi:hypothetical protein